jgi:cell division protein FtsI/penicillin-binding protein 2/cell division protein FtsW (lipid II flippase)
MRHSAPLREPLRRNARDVARVRTPLLAGVDPLLVAAVVTLGGFSLLNLASVDDPSLVIHQGACIALGLAAMLVMTRARPRRLRVLGRAIYGIAVVLLLGVAVAGTHAFGAQRWLALGSVVFQPSELAKLGLLLLLADILGSRPRRRHRVLIALAATAVPIALTLLEPDLSTALLLAVVAAAALLLAHVRVRTLLSLGGLAAVAVPFGLKLLRPYQLSRINAFLNGGAATTGAGWTRLQAHIAVGSGGLLGTLSPIPRDLLAQYLPARDTDLAFAGLIEQHGLVAGGCVLLAGVVAVWRLVAAARCTRTEIGSLIATGFAVLLGSEIAVNVAGNLGVLPLAGVPFPILSFGGSAVIAHCVAMGAVTGERRDELRRKLWVAPRWRRPRPRLARVAAVGLVIALVGLAVSTYRLQRDDGPQLREAALIEATRTVVLPGTRGLIEDRHGTPLALDAAVERVLAIPSIVNRQPGADARLAALLGESKLVVDRALSATPPYGGFAVVVASSVPQQVAAVLDAAHIPGVIVTPTVQRQYPYGPLFAPLLGFTGVETPADVSTYGHLPPDEIIGRTGLERVYDSTLRGRDGSQRLLVDPRGEPVAMGAVSAPGTGGDLRLSLDLGLQQAAAASLSNALKGVGNGQPRGDEGSVVVMDVHTGAVLAMVSLPAYDDNAFGPPVDAKAVASELSMQGDPFLEHATQTALPPGSTYKLVVAAADLAAGVVSPDLVIPTGASFNLGGYTFGNWSALPPQNLPQAVAWSNDVYFYKLALALGPETIAGVATQLGVGRTTGVDLPGESTGFLGTPERVHALGEQWYAGTTAMTGIGQGYLTATPLQDARWTAAVATGMLVTPHLAMAARPATDSTFTPMADAPPSPLPFAARLGPLQEGMREGVLNGTGTLLRTLPIPAAGKTGTAQDPSAPDGGPDAWYTAYSPADTPQVVVTVSVRGGGEGAYTAEPVARDVLAYFDTHVTQILSTAPATPVAASTTPSHPWAAALLAPPFSALRMRRRRRVARAQLRRLRRRTSADASHAIPTARTPPPACCRSPAAMSRRRTPGRRPA